MTIYLLNRVVKKSTDGRQRGTLPWVTQKMSGKRSLKANL